ncbi:hypothetical protein [Hirschia baltica]|uniref:OmpW family protein n=1 Tax=Hirschia baltica (strain ATCC 49814 / DSM 5838 / IFAM 1418) TaxID=582402 RepID=C6XN06_HIRBI|nr:hypothetical protein [Hirschia baltica]ACT58176.1 hypothetical protein Hbal_0474 [Hirschia baltica ATCC 49814]
MKKLALAITAFSTAFVSLPAKAEEADKLLPNLKLQSGLAKLAAIKKEQLLDYVAHSDTVFHLKRTLHTKPAKKQNNKASLAGSLHPFENKIIFSSSLYIGEKAIGGAKNITAPIRINGHLVSDNQFDIQDLQGRIGDSAAYTGIGINTSDSTRKSWGFNIMVGAMFSQNPEFTIATSERLYSDSLINLENLGSDQLALTEELSQFKITPVFNAGISYRF